jgi:TolB-like protein/DNA-binding winged helix-turn-helix (wHTH) protein/tetratricopeptide (TPR) repeat protein
MSQQKQNRNKGLYLFPPFTLDPCERSLLRDGEPVRLRAKAFDLLLNLVESAGTLRTRDELIEAIWPDTVVEEHGLTVGMSALRKALGDEDNPPRFIKTVRGYGYAFVAPVTFQPAQPEQPPAPPAQPPPAPATSRSRPRGLPAMLGVLVACVVAGGLYLREGRHAETAPTRDDVVAPAAPSIAVLPFEFIGEDHGNTFFAKGMRQTILARLARIGGLRVMSRSSSDDYPSHPENLGAVAEELSVSNVLEGNVQIAGQQVLINLRLIDARSGRHLWAGSYTRTLSDMIEVENDVAAHVATALETRLLPADTMRIARTPTGDSEAYVAFLKASYFEDQVTNRNNAVSPDAAVEQAAALYRKAIERDPGFALAYARLSMLESYAYWSSITRTAQSIPSARSAANRAVELDPSLPEAWLAKGYVHYYGERDYAAALAAFEHAADQVPNDVNAKVAIAYVQRRQGKLAEAIEGMRQASVMDPRNPRWPYEMALSLMAQRNYAEADHQFVRALALEPHNFACITNRVYALLLAGEAQRAVAVLDEVGSVADPLGQISALRFEIARQARDPDQAFASLVTQLDWVQAPDMGGNTPRSMMEAEAWTMRGDSVRAQAALRNAEQLLKAQLAAEPHNPDTWSALALVYAGLGVHDAAVEAGRRATEIVPISLDLIDGVIYTTVLARVYARLGDADMAVKLLRALLDMPGGQFLSVALLKTDPSWDRIRDDPGFQSLLKD